MKAAIQRDYVKIAKGFAQRVVDGKVPAANEIVSQAKDCLALLDKTDAQLLKKINRAIFRVEFSTIKHDTLSHWQIYTLVYASAQLAAGREVIKWKPL